MSVGCAKYPIPLVIKKVLTDRFDGKLYISSRDVTKTLYFLDGDLVYATSDRFDERIGVLLFILGKISDSQYKYINALSHTTDVEIGKMLVQNKFISKDDLFYATMYQIRKIAMTAFLIEKGEWELRPEKPKIILKRKHRIPLLPVISEGARKIENVSYYKNKIQFFSPKAGDMPDHIKQFLRPDEIQMYEELQSCENMANREIIAKLDLEPTYYWKKLVLFILLDLIDFVKHRVNYDINEDIRQLIIFQNRLDSGGLDNFGILGVDPEASRADLKLAYLKLSRRFHPDRFGSASAPQLKNVARHVVDKLKNAYQTQKKILKDQERLAKKAKEEQAAMDEVDLQPYLQGEVQIDLGDGAKENGVEFTELKETDLLVEASMESPDDAVRETDIEIDIQSELHEEVRERDIKVNFEEDLKVDRTEEPEIEIDIQSEMEVEKPPSLESKFNLWEDTKIRHSAELEIETDISQATETDGAEKLEVIHDIDHFDAGPKQPELETHIKGEIEAEELEDLEIIHDIDPFVEGPPLPEYETGEKEEEEMITEAEADPEMVQKDDKITEKPKPSAPVESDQTQPFKVRGIKSAGKRKRAGVIRSPVKVTDYLEEAEVLYKEKKYADAAKLLKMALRAEPNNGDYLCLLGLCQTHMEFFQDEAERHLRRAIELNPWTSDPVYALGVLFRIQGKQKQADKCFERVMSMTSNHHRAVAAMRANIKTHHKSGLFSIRKKDLKSK